VALRRLIAGDDRLDIDPVPGASEPLAPEFERLYGTPGRLRLTDRRPNP
jgi:hypothetical protein